MEYQIIQISRHETDGGIARIAGYLHGGYQKRGIRSVRLVGHTNLDTLELFDAIIHLHSLRWPFDLKGLPEWSNKIPLILHIHDASLLSGGCAHSLGCPGWLVGCEDSKCPAFIVQKMGPDRGSVAENWRLKRQAFSQSRLYVVAPCYWLMHKARRSILLPAIVEGRVIPHGVDSAVFYPTDKRRVRAELGLPLDATIILLVNQGSWRHYEFAMATVKRLYSRMTDDALILFVGTGLRAENVPESRLLVVEHQSPERIAAYYQASDIYLHPAAADTFPNVVLEALACGLPVVATAVGGIPEQVQDGLTGFLVSPMSSDAMADRAELLLQDKVLRRHMSEAAAQDARTRFGLDRMVDTFTQWYESIAGRANA